MHAKQALRISMDMGHFVVGSYLSDLSDADLLHRPCAGCNHINWQLGHLITSANYHMSKAAGTGQIELPPGFSEKYGPDAAGSDDPTKFCKKAELLELYEKQHASILAALENLPDSELDRTTGIDYAPTVAALFELQGSHKLMHAGQWAVVRRQLGRKPLF